VTACTDRDGDSLLLNRAIQAVVTCGARTLNRLLDQLVDDAPGVHPDESKQAVPGALQTAVLHVDDLSGQTHFAGQNQTVRFALDGQSYEIDLSDQDAADFRRALQPYVQSGRQASRRTRNSASPRGRTPGRRGTQAGRREDNAAIRDWARAHGHEVSDRGRIPMHVVQAYQATGG
jgi:hypothetical protein